MTEQELKEKYPAYSKSIFSNIMPDDSEVIEWQENVLEKIKGNSILPHYISKDKDFDIFWGWIIHFLAIIVIFCRNLKRIFINYESYLDEIGEFMREKDYIKDSRVQINKDLKISITERLYHKIFTDTKLIDGIATPTNGYYCTDFLPITEGNIIILKVLGYNQNSDEYIPSAINNINISYYYSDKNLAYIDTTSYSLSSNEAKLGKRFYLKNSLDNTIPYCYIRISYPSLGNSSLPLYLDVFFEGEGSIFETENSEENIFDVYSDFRKRGTFKGAALIKKILEVKKEDNFYADFLPQNNTGWFLNRNSPTFSELNEKIKIDAFTPNIFAPLASIRYSQESEYVIIDGINKNGAISSSLPNNLPLPHPLSEEDRIISFVTFENQYFLLNQNTSIKVEWNGNVYSYSSSNILIDSEGYELLDSNGYNLIVPEAINSENSFDVGESEIILYFTLYDKNKNKIYDIPILGNWEYNDTNKIIEPEGKDELLGKDYTLTFLSAYLDTYLGETLKAGTVITSFTGFNGNVFYKNNNSSSFKVINAASIPYTLEEDAEVWRGSEAGTLNFHVQGKYEQTEYKKVSLIPKYNSLKNNYYVDFPIEIIDSSQKAFFPIDTYDKDYFILNNKLYIFNKYNNSKTHEAYYIGIRYIELINTDINTSGYNNYNEYLENFECSLYLRKLQNTIGFLNIKQYYLCSFKNNSGYTNEEAEEIINQKVLPYNGYRLFLDNSYYKNNINIPLQFISLNYEKTISSTIIKIKIKIKGGIPPYKYYINEALVATSYLQEYEYNLSINNVREGTINISVKDFLEKEIYSNLNYNIIYNINYKIKLFVDVDYNLKSYLKVLGNAEEIFTLEKRLNNNTLILEKNLPKNNLIDITEFLYSLTEIQGKFLRIRNNVTSDTLDIPGEDFKKFGLDIYDNGEGELIEE